MARFLFATIPAVGHVAPLVPVAEALVARGNEVAWYASAAFKSTVQATGATHHPLESAPDWGDGDVDRHFPGRLKYRGLRRMVYDFEHGFINPTVGYLTDLRAIIRDFSPDVLVTDPALIAGAVLGEVDGVPTAVINVSVLALPSQDLAPFGLGLPPSSSALGHLRNRLLTLLVDHVIFRRPNRVYAALARRHGWPVFPVRPRAPRWLFLQPSIPALEYPRPDLPPQVHYVGPLLPTTAGDLPADWRAEIEAARARGRRVVLVTQGTVATDPVELIRPTLEALASEDLLVLVAGADPTAFGSIPGNARVARFVPFRPLMPLVDAYVTNGGYGGLMTALAAGVPVVTSGTTEDKTEVGGRVAYAGVGVDLRSNRPDPERLRGAVRTVLADPRYRAAAARVADEFAAHDGPTEAAALLETLAETGAPVLRGETAGSAAPTADAEGRGRLTGPRPARPG